MKQEALVTSMNSKMIELYLVNNGRTDDKFILRTDSEDAINNAIHDFVDTHDYTSPYWRTWGIYGEKQMVDVGSYSEFFEIRWV